MAETLEKDAETLETLNGAEDGGENRAEDETLDSSSSSESDDDEPGLQLEVLEKAVAENPSNYEAHVQYIKCLRRLGHIEMLRQARKSMREIFPLSPKMWQEWANDEASLSTSSEDFAAVEEIFEQGVQEYLYVPLWCAYLYYVQEHPSVSECGPAGVLKMRNLFERALTAAGLHVLEGSKIWDAYREFEKAIFLTIDAGDNEERAKQVHRIRSLFHRQLSVPLVDLRSVWLAYKLWEVGQGNIINVNSDELDGIPSNVATAYQKALEMYDARAPYEDQLSNPEAFDADKIQLFMNYVKFEESYGDPARVQILYERGVSDVPLSSDLWVGYTSYLDKTLKVPSILKNIYSRATRNCTWVGDLWSRYLLSLERMCASEEELSAVFEKSLQCAFSSFYEYLDLFLTRIDGLRRRISLAAVRKDGVDYGLIRHTFQRASDYLSPQVIKTDHIIRLYAYWARLEVSLGQDLVAARGVWESLIKRSGSVLEVWQGYIQMEIEMGHRNEARSIYKRCYSKRFLESGSEDICYSWLRFEREFGSLDDLDLAMRKVMPRLEELRQFKAQQQSKNITSSTAHKDGFLAKGASQKRKASNVPPDKQSPAKRQKDVPMKPVVASHGATTQKPLNVNSKIMVDTPASSNLPESDNNEAKNEQSVGDSIPKEAKPSFYTDQCTAFISNISLKANEEHLRQFFGSNGGVTAIRLLREKFTNKSRGLAYVDFLDDEHLSAAISKNKQKLLGQKLSIARSDPKRSQRKTSAGRRTASDDTRSVNQNMTETSSGSPKESVSHKRDDSIKLTGKNTFAVPRTLVRPLGWVNKEAKIEEGEEKPKSNDEFRTMLLKN